MFVHTIDPVLLELGPFQIRYYGLFFVLGFIVAYFMLRFLAKERHINLTKDEIADYVLYSAIGIVLGARIFYIVFYNLPFYLENPLRIFALWQGGLSFHGGLTGAIVTTYIFCKKKKLHIYDILDMAVIPAALGLALGRLGNFTNGELYGRITNVPWAVQFPGAEGFRHPSQFYESFKNLAIFFILFMIRNRNLPRGILFWMFVALYSIFRFFIEFFREADAQIGYFFGWMTMGQILCIIFLVISLYFLDKIRKTEVRK